MKIASFLDSLKDAFTAIKENPKLFFPKILLALVWGVFLLYLSSLFLELLAIDLTNQQQAMSVVPLIFDRIAWFFLFFAAFYLVDIYVNAIYPFLLKQFFEKKPISLLQAFRYVSNNLLRIFSPILAAILVIFVVCLPFSIFLAFALVLKDSLLVFLAAALAIIVVFLLSAVFYFVYPISVLEKVGLGSLLYSANGLKKNPKTVSLAVLITYVLSLATVFLAFGIEAVQFAGVYGLILFFVLRIITALLATYQMVLNPVIYIEFVKKMKLSD